MGNDVNNDMKRVLISGASSGIGKTMVRVFAREGWQVFILARRQDRLQEISREIKNTCILVCDLTDSRAVENLKDQIPSPFHALVNNAGVYHPCSLEEDQDQVWDTHYNSNLMGSVRLTRLLWPQLKGSRGSIVNISSTLAIRPIAGTAAYSALKAAMNSWTLSLALEGAPHGINANAICPGIVDTPIHSYFGDEGPKDMEFYKQVQKAQPLGRTGRPEDIAFMAERLCKADSQWITGAIINIDGGILLRS